MNHYQLASCKWKEGLQLRVRARAPRLPSALSGELRQQVCRRPVALRGALWLPHSLQGRGKRVQTASGHPSYHQPHGKGGAGHQASSGRCGS